MLKEFKAFILRGTVLDLAVGVIIGGAFTAIVKSLVDNLINPLIGIFVQDGALAQLSFKLGNATFAYGKFLNDVELLAFVFERGEQVKNVGALELDRIGKMI